MGGEFSNGTRSIDTAEAIFRIECEVVFALEDLVPGITGEAKDAIRPAGWLIEDE